MAAAAVVMPAAGSEGLARALMAGDGAGHPIKVCGKCECAHTARRGLHAFSRVLPRPRATGDMPSSRHSELSGGVAPLCHATPRVLEWVCLRACDRAAHA